MAGQNAKRNSITVGSDLSAGEQHRTLTLHELRPLELIGRSVQLYPWEKQFVADLSTVKRSTREFYENQNEAIQSLEFVDSILDSGLHATLIEEYSDDIGQEAPRQRQPVPQTLLASNSSSDTEQAGPHVSGDTPNYELDSSSRRVQFWINLNLGVNVLLLVGKFAVYCMTNSLSIGASLVDSLLDLLSTLIIFASAWFAGQRDWRSKHMYPVGRFRLEPIGILVFSVMMVVSFIKVAEDAVTRLFFSHEKLEIVTIGLPSFAVMVGTLVIKGVIWWLCRHVRNSSVRALSQDALTDCYFNFFSVLFPIFSSILVWPELDPLGALLLSLYIVWSWGQTAMEHIGNLTGAASSPIERQQILYMCTRFSERIKYVTALTAYHAGDRLMCEVDILLDPSLSMRDSHDIAEALQYALETMPIVERAFVHIDYRRGNFTGHVV